VGVDNVDVWQAEAFEGEVEALNDVFPGEADVIDWVGWVVGVVEAEVDFCGYHEIVLLPAELIDGLAEHDFGFPSGVVLCCVEEVDTGIVRLLEDVECVFYKGRISIRSEKM
jgi:hypothetical protein